MLKVSHFCFYIILSSSFFSFYLLIVHRDTDVYHCFQLLPHDTPYVLAECLRDMDSYLLLVIIYHTGEIMVIYLLCFHSVLIYKLNR